MGVKIFDKYEISENGIIRNIKTGRELHQFPNRRGYMVVQIAGKTRTVHRLVATAFLTPEHGRDFINHKDGDKRNNSVDNLEWCSRSENMKHAYKMGLKNSYGSKNGRSKLTETDVIFIRKHYIAKDKQFGATALAKKFGVARQTISAVGNGQNWRKK